MFSKELKAINKLNYLKTKLFKAFIKVLPVFFIAASV
jgi:hypothetical protein